HIRLAVLRDQRLHARPRVTKPLGDLGRRQLLHVVGAQRLIPTVRCDRRLGEALVSRPGHRSADLADNPADMMMHPPDGTRRPNRRHPAEYPNAMGSSPPVFVRGTAHNRAIAQDQSTKLAKPAPPGPPEAPTTATVAD